MINEVEMEKNCTALQVG